MKRRKRYRAKYDLFPTDMFNTRDLNWYPPSDYRTAVVGTEGAPTGPPCLGESRGLLLACMVVVRCMLHAKCHVILE